MAARYARADAAKQFLQCGADPNIKDIKGRTPLHAAIASDSYGVFTIILNDRNGFFTVSRKLVLYLKKMDRKSIWIENPYLGTVINPIKDVVISKQNQKTDQLV